MKAEKVLGIMACAFVCASSSVFANTTSNWFGVVASDVVVATNNATVVGTIEKIEASKIFIDNDKDSAYTVTPTVAMPALNDGLVTIASSAVLTPSDVSDLELVGAQAGFAVGVSNNVTNFYGFASAATNGLPAWIQLSGTPSDPESATQFKIVLDYRKSTVQFYKDDAPLSGYTNGVQTSSFAISNNFVNLSSVAAYGSGAITSIASEYEVAVAAVVTGGGATTNKYGSVADAIVAGGDVSTIHSISGSGEVSETGSSTSGLPVAVCLALGIDTEAESPVIKVVPAATDEDQDNISFAMDTTGLNVDPSVVVKFQVMKGGANVGEPCNANAIKIPLSEGTGTYTVQPVAVEAASN